MYKHRHVFFDCEATSNKPLEAYVISLGSQVTEYDGKMFQPIDNHGFHSFVKTDKHSDDAAQAVHNISRDKLERAPRFPEVVEQWKAYLRPYMADNVRFVLTGHNCMGFDIPALFCNFVRNRLDFEQFLRDIRCVGFVDTLPMLRKLFSTQPKEARPHDPETKKEQYTLTSCYITLCNARDTEGAHDALFDSKMLVSVCNSPSVCKILNSVKLFSFLLKRDVGMKKVKTSAGAVFSATQRVAQSKPAAPVETSDQPVWDAERRFCLNCVSFTEHDRCQLSLRAVKRPLEEMQVQE